MSFLGIRFYLEIIYYMSSSDNFSFFGSNQPMHLEINAI